MKNAPIETGLYVRVSVGGSDEAKLIKRRFHYARLNRRSRKINFYVSEIAA